MIHPQYWSLASVYYRLKFNGANMGTDDFYAYSMLPVKGKVVLDVGAYNGDSARYFLKRGARSVVCIEIDRRLADSISIPRVKVYNKPFGLEDLSIPHDCMKVDIEGYEDVLLDVPVGLLKPTVMEVHGQHLVDKFVSAGWRVICRNPLAGCLALVKNF